MALRKEWWLPSGQAALALGISVRTLKRYADLHNFLVEGKHWRFGPMSNSPRQWNISACEEALAYRGRLTRKQMAQSAAD
ncbi:hypothetical protein [Synechococcus sp. CBW1107]|uniref:hypothetical protein n=1 Tax=Synechococcus sp. CBW1107 TaxID=2789857 RepID=UPI002AD23A86|nr:hypothetical protein [Synechococcus sp. CBW1107]CAK6688216.1 hypothetical protein IFHNHDMJ_00358 [Synechococcus sp. CBW1107]